MSMIGAESNFKSNKETTVINLSTVSKSSGLLSEQFSRGHQSGPHVDRAVLG